jgi:uncharacterized protein (DUF488 family)
MSAGVRNRTSTGHTLSWTARTVKQLPLPPPFSPPHETDGDARPPGTESLTILTIGHSNHERETFLALLQRHGIATLIDVRSAPYSRYAPHFGKGPLRALLDGVGIRYVWAGDTLGGRPADPACYRDGQVRAGNVDYAALAGKPWYHAGVVCLLHEAAAGPVAIMCSEEDPRRCHRHRLIEPSLRERGVSVRHIRGDGTLETIDLGESAAPSPLPQLVLQGFGE